MSNHDNTRYQALYYLTENMPPKQIAETMDISYATALRYKKEYDDAVVAGTIKQLLDFPSAVLDHIIKVTKDEAPVTIDNETSQVVKSLKSLDVLREDLHSTAELISRRVRTLVMSVETADDLLILTECLAKLQNAFFNSNSINIAVQQNNQSSEGTKTKYGAFLNDRPKNI